MNRRKILSAAFASLALPIAGAAYARPAPISLPEGVLGFGKVTFNAGRTYEVLCSGTAIHSVQRIWDGEKLVWEAPQSAASPASAGAI